VWDISRLTKVTHFITTKVNKICFILIGTCIVQIKSNKFYVKSARHKQYNISS